MDTRRLGLTSATSFSSTWARTWMRRSSARVATTVPPFWRSATAVPTSTCRRTTTPSTGERITVLARSRSTRRWAFSASRTAARRAASSACASERAISSTAALWARSSMCSFETTPFSKRRRSRSRSRRAFWSSTQARPTRSNRARARRISRTAASSATRSSSRSRSSSTSG